MNGGALSVGLIKAR